jgi:hypothetical protein
MQSLTTWNKNHSSRTGTFVKKYLETQISEVP